MQVRERTTQRRKWRWLALQLGIVAALLLLLWLLLSTTAANMRERGIQSGFDFLLQPAGFGIGEGVFAFESGDAYWLAFGAGLANSLRVAIPGILLATVLGALVGIGRLSSNLMLRGLCSIYVEIFRNIPLLLQLLVCYFLLTDLLPDSQSAIRIASHVFLSKSGLAMPWPDGSGTALDFPAMGEFGISGGAVLTPEFLAMLLGLFLYTSAYIAEIVRSGILSIPAGQVLAASALGLSRRHTLWLIQIPQALRLMVPPLTNQYLNLIKNSSLAVAIGYPDLVSISNTTINQTGHAAECLVILVAVYLLLSLTTAWLTSHLTSSAEGRPSGPSGE